MSRKSIEIKNLALIKVENGQVLSAEVDGEKLWFEFSNDIEIEPRGDLFLSMALLEAMISDLPIKVADDIPVSPLLLRSLEKLQEIYICWNRDLHKVSINASRVEAPKVKNKGMAGFFSGGVDGSATYCKHKGDITHLVTLAGFDALSKAHQWPELVSKHQKFSTAQGVKFLGVDNNARQFFNRRKISYAFQHGLTMAGIGITLGFEKVFIPSTFTYSELFSWGSHPDTDPLWSVEGRSIIHDGAEFSRSDKIAFIGKTQSVLDNLQVCWKNISFNCDVCSKCLRTRAALYLLKLTSENLAPLESASELKSIRITGKSALPYAQDLAKLANQSQQVEIEKVFSSMVKKYLVKYHFEEMMKALFGNKLKVLVHKVRGAPWKENRVSMDSNQGK